LRHDAVTERSLPPETDVPPTDVRHPSPRTPMRKTPPQGLRLRRFKRPVPLVRLAGASSPGPHGPARKGR